MIMNNIPCKYTNNFAYTRLHEYVIFQDGNWTIGHWTFGHLTF